MDKVNFVRDGGSKLPPGFRFEPTDEEIVFMYLARKIFSYPLPAHIIPEINIFSFDPWELPGNLEQDRYFFSNKEANYNRPCNRPGRFATCSGYWQFTGSTKRIICSKRMPMVGIKKSLVFYKARKADSRAFKTDWAMHEYYIALSGNTSSNIQSKNNSQGSLVRVGNWTLCRVFMKKTTSSAIAQVDDSDEPRNYCEYMRDDGDTSDTDSSCASSSSPHCDQSSILNDEVSSSVANSETYCN